MAPRALRPTDLAREHGLSTQAIRNYEDEGILPPAERTPTGYRQYSPVHAQALRAFLALRRGYGHQTAAAILRAAHRRDDETLFRHIDRAHADLLRERDTLDEVAAALDTLTTGGVPHEGRRTEELTIGALAHQLETHPATLRKWERAGLLRPHRARSTGCRAYPPEAVRDALMIRQLRRGGYSLARIGLFLDQLRGTDGDTSALDDVLRSWRTRIGQRSRAMLAAGHQLDAYLDLLCAG